MKSEENGKKEKDKKKYLDFEEKENYKRMMECLLIKPFNIHTSLGYKIGDGELLGMFIVMELMSDIFSLAINFSEENKELYRKKIERFELGKIDVRPEVWNEIVKRKFRTKRGIKNLKNEALFKARRIMLLNGDMLGKLKKFINYGKVKTERKTPFACMKSVCSIFIHYKDCDTCENWESKMEESAKLFKDGTPPCANEDGSIKK